MQVPRAPLLGCQGVERTLAVVQGSPVARFPLGWLDGRPVNGRFLPAAVQLHQTVLTGLGPGCLTAMHVCICVCAVRV